jgi:hypothetical protein
MSLADLNPSDAGRGVFIRKQTANIYTVMLILSFVFIAIGCLFLFLELKAYDGLTTKVAADAKVPLAPPPPEQEATPPVQEGAPATPASNDTPAPAPAETPAATAPPADRAAPPAQN